jgi:hypothetical protein
MYSAAALITPQCDYFRAPSRFFSAGNDLTGRGALPMFPAAGKLRLGRRMSKKLLRSLD